MGKKSNVSFMKVEKLEKLSTERLLALKKTVVAKKSAVYSRNRYILEDVEHPFLIAEALAVDAKLHAKLQTYLLDIKDILENRENVK